MNESSGGFIAKFTVLKTAPRELWLTYLINVTEYVAYSLMQYSLMLWLLKDMQLSDQNAAYTLMVWGMILSAMMTLAGMVTDGLGIKRSFLIGYATCVIGRGAIAFNLPFLGALLIGLGPIAAGMALMSPVVAAAIRRYTHKDQRSIAFSLFYVLMNVGYAVGGWGHDMLRKIVAGFGGSVSIMGFVMSEFQFQFFLAAAITIFGVLVIRFFFREGVEVDEHSGAATVGEKQKAENPLRILLEVVREKRFWIFILFLLFLVGVKSVFYHMHYTLPPFCERFIGKGAKYGTAFGAFNPLIIVALVPFIGALTQKISSFKMIVGGSILSGVSCFILCLPLSWFEPLAQGPAGRLIAAALDIDGPLHPWYIPLLLFVFFFTIGEGIWSPRLFEYTASIAPKGREGSYMSLSILPWFASKPLVAGLQAWILPAYAPEGGPFDYVTFWGIIGLTAISSPILVLVFKNFINPDTPAAPEPKPSAPQ